MDENKKVHVTVTDTEGKVVLERDTDVASVICVDEKNITRILRCAEVVSSYEVLQAAALSAIQRELLVRIVLDESEQLAHFANALGKDLEQLIQKQVEEIKVEFVSQMEEKTDGTV